MSSAVAGLSLPIGFPIRGRIAELKHTGNFVRLLAFSNNRVLLAFAVRNSGLVGLDLDEKLFLRRPFVMDFRHRPVSFRTSHGLDKERRTKRVSESDHSDGWS
jgi:hypothetical protein